MPRQEHADAQGQSTDDLPHIWTSGAASRMGMVRIRRKTNAAYRAVGRSNRWARASVQATTGIRDTS